MSASPWCGDKSLLIRKLSVWMVRCLLSVYRMKFDIYLYFLVRLWSTYRVHFCQDQVHDYEDHDDQINPIGMFNSSNESSQRTE